MGAHWGAGYVFSRGKDLSKITCLEKEQLGLLGSLQSFFPHPTLHSLSMPQGKNERVMETEASC